MGTVLHRIRAIIDGIVGIYTVIGWFGFSAGLAGLAVLAGAVVRAMITGTSGPIVIMAAFCMVTAICYLSLLPMAYRVMARMQGVPLQRKPHPEIWRHFQTYILWQAAACWQILIQSTPRHSALVRLAIGRIAWTGLAE
jgi:hypothetical protein